MVSKPANPPHVTASDCAEAMEGETGMGRAIRTPPVVTPPQKANMVLKVVLCIVEGAVAGIFHAGVMIVWEVLTQGLRAPHG